MVCIFLYSDGMKPPYLDTFHAVTGINVGKNIDQKDWFFCDVLATNFR